ncbi:MAG: BLUF domain-containing protein [Cytophagales bacterium]|nr:BLUF domain-containing protein [Cytophagales bacterium]
MYYLIYVSQATRPFTTDELKELARMCYQNNIDRDITGMLVYLENKFLQVLEGTKEEVQGLFSSISQDPRHKKVSVLIEGEISQRNFPKWSMGFKAVDKQLFQDLTGFENLEEFFNRSDVDNESHLSLIFLKLFYRKNYRDFADLY